MGTRKVEQGEVGHVVAAQIRQIRERKQLSLQALSDRLAALGRPILPSGLSKIEQGTRRVDVDDLVAIAAALETIPSRLIGAYGDGLDVDFLIRSEELHSKVLRDAVRALRAAEDAGLTRYEVVEWMEAAARMRPILERLTKSILSKEMASVAAAMGMARDWINAGDTFRRAAEQYSGRFAAEAESDDMGRFAAEAESDDIGRFAAEAKAKDTDE